jgi:hypothetical protein
MSNGSGVSWGDRNRSARLLGLRAHCRRPATTAYSSRAYVEHGARSWSQSCTHGGVAPETGPTRGERLMLNERGRV